MVMLLMDKILLVKTNLSNVFVACVVLTFVCTEMLTIIRDKSIMERVFERVLFIFCKKQVLASALITFDNNYKEIKGELAYISTKRE